MLDTREIRQLRVAHKHTMLLLPLRATSAAAEMLSTAAQVAAGVSFSYNAPEFLVLRIGLLDGYSINARDLVLLEAGVQKVIMVTGQQRAMP